MNIFQRLFLLGVNIWGWIFFLGASLMLATPDWWPSFLLLSSFAITCHFFFGLLIIPISRQTPDCDIALWTQILWTWTWKTRTGVNTFPAKYMLREAIIREKKDFLWNHFIKWWPPPVPLLWSPYLFFFRPFFERKK